MTSRTDTYDGIFAEVQRQLNRTDLTTDDLNSFIRLAEKRLYRKLRIPANQKKVTATVALPDWNPETSPGVPNPDYRPYDASGFGIPGDYLEGFLTYDFNGSKIERISSQYFRSLPNQIAHTATYYTGEAGQFYFWPSFSGDVFMLYYFEPEPISSTNQQNEVTHIIGEAIVYGAIAEGWRFIRDQEKYGYFRQLMQECFEEVTAQWRQQEMSGSSMQAKNPYEAGGSNWGTY